ncbi:MAG: hypothetical protein SFV22_00910 [Saprospiraceae bacterium]|nr:hypothetical protein [Saprospiraceae bacterium]
MENNFMLTDDLLWDYADGFLDRQEQLRVEAYLEQNPAQKARLEVILSEKQALSKLSPEMPPSDFSRNVMAAWAAEQASAVQKAKGRDWILWGIGLLFGLMLIAPMIMLFLSVPADFSVQIPQEYIPQMPQFDWVALLDSALFRNLLLISLALMSLKILEKYLQVRYLNLTTR